MLQLLLCVIMQNTSARILEIKIHVISLQIKAHFTCILENVSAMNNRWPLVAHHIHFQRSYCELWASCCKLAHWQAPLACQWVLRGSQSNCMNGEKNLGPIRSTKRATEETNEVRSLYLQRIPCCSITFTVWSHIAANKSGSPHPTAHNFTGLSYKSNY